MHPRPRTRASLPSWCHRSAESWRHPKSPEDALKFYQDAFAELLETETWKTFAEKNGIVTELRIGDEWGEFLADQEELVREKLDEVGLLIEN